jgi:hypothetical protein
MGACAPYAVTGRAWCLWARMELLDGVSIKDRSGFAPSSSSILSDSDSGRITDTVAIRSSCGGGVPCDVARRWLLSPRSFSLYRLSRRDVTVVTVVAQRDGTVPPPRAT